MRTSPILLVTAILLTGIIVLPQTVKIVPRKTTYRRQKPQYDFKRTFTIRRPIATASTVALSRKITAAISPERVLDLNIREELTEFQWLEEADYKVIFNQNGVLCIELWMTGTAAYPDSVTKAVVVDIRTGRVARVPDLFRQLPELAKLVRKKQLAEIAQATEEMRSDPDASPDQLFSEARFTTEDFDQFTVDSQGVTFRYDYGFPHVLEALQPAGEFHFSWAELKPFIRMDGLLARFVR